MSFPGSSVHALRLNATTMNSVDFRAATALEVVGDVLSLRGATIDQAQLLDLAPTLAHGLGIVTAPITSRARAMRPSTD